MSGTMELSQDALRQIGEYVKAHIPEWVRDTPEIQREYDLRERAVRVEEELKTQRQLMERGFNAMEKRFEAIDSRFEAIEKRFEMIDKRFETIDKRFDGMENRFAEQTAFFNTRFEDMNHRFEDMHKHTNRWMMLISVFLAVIGAMPWIMGAY